MDSLKAIRDTLYNREKAELLVTANEQFKTKEKETQIALQELQLQRQKRIRNLIIMGSVLIILVFILFFQYFRNLQKLRRKETETALQIKKSEAAKLKELDELKSAFFANISHEFRTPLSLIIGPIKSALEQVPASENLLQAEALSMPISHLLVMERNALRLNNLIDQLLDLSKLDNNKMSLQVCKGKIIQFLRSMIFSFESLAERKRIHLQTSFPPEVEDAYFDADKLEKILVNLLSNAFKFTPEHGQIKVIIQIKNNLLKIRLSDSGPGIGIQHLDKIFDRFYQVEGDEYKGSGIGLALVKELVELHKGSINVESNQGQGTIFRLKLPYQKSAFTEKEFIPIRELTSQDFGAITSSISESKSQSTESISQNTGLPLALIVEDNPDLLQYITEILAPNYNIITSRNGEEGFKQAQDQIPDIIISDIMMPKMNGLELSKLIKQEEKTNHIPIILLTAKAGQKPKIEGLQTGADDYLTKPFDAQELKARMANLIKQRQLLQEKFQGQLKIHPKQIKVNSMDERFLKQVMLEIEKNIGNEFYTVEDLARSTNYSRSQLHRKLKALCDKSPNELIREFRLSRAKELLEQKAGNVSEIAFQVGYSNLSYFAKSFHKAFGLNPSEVT